MEVTQVFHLFGNKALCPKTSHWPTGLVIPDLYTYECVRPTTIIKFVTFTFVWLHLYALDPSPISGHRTSDLWLHIKWSTVIKSRTLLPKPTMDWSTFQKWPTVIIECFCRVCFSSIPRRIFFSGGWCVLDFWWIWQRPWCSILIFYKIFRLLSNVQWRIVQVRCWKVVGWHLLLCAWYIVNSFPLAFKIVC